ncbi:MAG: exodeoxyribonuclease V subunit beta [Desulfamplus sp.]|nr:exodeoxyribonuclease V subunit beta [Desulfamplus sp.]
MKKFDITKAPLKGLSVIEASAGTGKTYAIAGIFLRLILEGSFKVKDKKYGALQSDKIQYLKINQIVVVTFTKAATEELRDRIRRRLKDALMALTDKGGYKGGDPVLLWAYQKYGDDKGAHNRLKEAIICFDESAIFTIHGFCQKMLSENAFESNTLFDTELLLDDSDLLIEACQDYYRRNFFSMNPLLFSHPKVKSIDTKYLLKLVRCLLVDPNFKIIPDSSSYKKDKIIYSLTPLIKEAQPLYLSLQDGWIKDRDNIFDLILTSCKNKAFDGRSIKESTYPNLFSIVDNYFQGENFWNIEKDKNSDIRYIEKLTNRFMRQKAKSVDKLPSHPFFQKVEDFLGLVDEIDKLVEEFCISIKLDFLTSAKDELKKKKSLKNVRAFDDLLLSMYRAVEGGDTPMVRAIRDRFFVALIDEFQDTDPLQYSIFTNIFQKDKESLLYLIGDPKQAIYGFRGADIYAYLKAKKSVDSAYTLSTNWRADGSLVAAVNSLFDIKGRNPFVIDGIDFIPVNHAPDREDGSLYIDDSQYKPMNIAIIDQKLSDSKKQAGSINKGTTEEFAAKFTAGKIAQLINLGACGRAVIKNRVANSQKSLEPQDIAVLVRTNRQGNIVLMELKKLKIPGVIYSAGSVYAEEEAIELERFMRAAAEPSNERLLKGALITALFGFDGQQIVELSSNEMLYDSLQNDFLEYNTIWRQFGFISMLRYMMQKRGVRAKLLGYSGGERKLTNYLHIAELLHIADMKLKPGIDGLINFLAKRRLDSLDKPDADEYRLRLETDEKAVKIITIHRSKGLEFDVVFCPYLYHAMDSKDEGFVSFHDDVQSHKVLDIGSDNYDKHKEKMIEESFAESVRLAYVALTRAKYCCFTVWGKISSSENSPLSWLFHGDKFLDKGLNLAKGRQSLKQLSWEDIKSDVDRVANLSGSTIKVEVVSDIKSLPYLPLNEKTITLEHKQFKGGSSGKIPYGWRISSFTSIFSGRAMDFDMPDHDEISDYDKRAQPDFVEDLPKDLSSLISLKSKDEDNLKAAFFDFPKGARAGTCIHEIMESIDFTRPDINIAKQKLEKFGFKEEDELQKVEEMLNRLLNSNIMFGTSYPIYLNQIRNLDRLNEMEFYIPVGDTNSSLLSSLMSKYGSGAILDFALTMKSLNFSQKGGYLKGFIDMVFCHNNRYYLLDWKTNYLGDRFEDYSFDTLSSQMKSSGYTLQYLIYTVALNAYLEHRVVNYNYDSHFGGVFYIFMRGVQSELKSGVYFDCPNKEVVDELTKAICGSNFIGEING